MSSKWTSTDHYFLQTINRAWFQGKIYLDRKAEIPLFQQDLVNDFIARIVTGKPELDDYELDFTIVVTGDSNGAEFTVDFFAYGEDDLVINGQEFFFNNMFSAIHWALSAILAGLEAQLNAEEIANELDETIEEQTKLDQTGKAVNRALGEASDYDDGYDDDKNDDDEETDPA